jgi:dipeptidyl aminopeptidase/acylaminoacyl peptidase
LAKSFLGVALVAALWGTGVAHAQKLEVEALSRMPEVTGVSMSKEGDFLVAIVADPTNTDRRAIATWNIANVDGTKPLAAGEITPGNDKMSFVGASALKAGKIITVASQPWTGSLNGCGEGNSTGATKTWRYKTFLTTPAIEDFDDVFAGGRSVGVNELTEHCFELAGDPDFIDLPLDPENLIVARTDITSGEATFSKVNLKTGRSTFLFSDDGDFSIGLLDPRDGKILTKGKIEPQGNDEYHAETYILNRETGRFDLEAPLTSDFRNRNQMDVAAYDEETGKYFIVTDKFSDRAAIYLYDAKTDKFDDEPLFAHQDFDAGGVILGRNKSDFGQILGFTYLGGGVETYWVDPSLKSIQDGLKNSFKDQDVRIIDYTDDRNKVLFSTESAEKPPHYYLLLNKSKLLGVGGERPWIKPGSVGKQSLVYYTARDGMKIPGILTMPAGWKQGDPAPPAIVHPHGGPWARDFTGWDFSGWIQLLSSRGYAVLQPQYRGSQGFGHNLWLAGDAQWGLKMQDDKDDGAKWMVEQGFAAKDRIAIFGYSYGGFAAFAAAVRPDGPFKCAIAGAGVSNLTRIGNNWSANRQQRAYQGRTVKGMDPQQNVGKLSMPILIFHGDRDVRVPLYHATDFYNAVKNTGKAKLMILKDMGHQGDKWTADNTRDALNAIESFLANECKL